MAEKAALEDPDAIERDEEDDMTTSLKPEPGVAKPGTPGADDARRRLERLYRKIGISAVAAAVAQIRRPEAAPAREPQMPAWLREDAA